MNELKNKKHYLGIDISKDTLDLSLIHKSSYGTFKDKKVLNSFNGFKILYSWLLKEKVDINECLICMEHTGAYGLLLFAWLSQTGIDYCVEPGLEIKRSIGITRGKSDRVDARRIADYAYTHVEKLKLFKFPSTLMIQIKQSLTYREQMVKIKTALKNSLKSHNEYQKVSGLIKISEQISQQIKEQEKNIKKIENQIVDLINTDKNVKKNFEMAKSVKGIGFVISAFMLVTTNNFTGFENGRKYACYAGVAPFEFVSGTSIRGKTKVSNLGNKKIKALLSNGANSACKYDLELNAYYKRKSKEGKDHKVIINAISCKLINRVFAVVKRQTPYVSIYEQNFA